MSPIWGFPKIRATFLRGPHNKDYDILVGSILGTTILGNYHMGTSILRFLI